MLCGICSKAQTYVKGTLLTTEYPTKSLKGVLFLHRVDHGYKVPSPLTLLKLNPSQRQVVQNADA